ncbi:hypothetical protein ACQ4PT_069125 [Festuca glaucescens]
MAVSLARSGFAADLPSYGRSHGLRAFVPKLEPAVADLLAFFRSVSRWDEHAGLLCFLCRSPTGSACPGWCLRSSPAEDLIEDERRGRQPDRGLPDPDRGFDCVFSFF